MQSPIIFRSSISRPSRILPWTGAVLSFLLSLFFFLVSFHRFHQPHDPISDTKLILSITIMIAFLLSSLIFCLSPLLPPRVKLEFHPSSHTIVFKRRNLFSTTTFLFPMGSFLGPEIVSYSFLEDRQYVLQLKFSTSKINHDDIQNETIGYQRDGVLCLYMDSIYISNDSPSLPGQSFIFQQAKDIQAYWKQCGSTFQCQQEFIISISDTADENFPLIT